MRPGVLAGSASGHDSDMPTPDAEQFLVWAANLRHDGLRLARRSNVVILGDHGQQIGVNAAEVDTLTSNHELTTHQLVVAVQVYDKLAEGTPGERHVVGHPGVHGMPGFHHARIADVVP